MRIETVIVGMLEVNCYVLYDDERRALIVDPGAQPELIVEFLNETDLKPVGYLITHGHVDHIGALAVLHRRFPAPVEMNAADVKWAFGRNNQILPFYPPPEAPSEIANKVEDGQVFMTGALKHHVLTTPGHTPGGVCFYFEEEGVVCTGDTLFNGTVGRTDLPGGNSKILLESLGKLAKLPPGIRILAGHGLESAMAYELANNPFMGAGQRRL